MPASRAGPPCTAASDRPALVRLWLRGVQRLAAGPVARVSPDVLSVAGVAAAGGAAVVAAQGGRWPLVAAALVVLAGVLDGLDGAVALHTGRARPLGAVVDAVADRVGDLLLVATLAVLGAPPAWCVAAGALTLLHEYLRARAGAAGMPGVGALTVAERPTRLVLVAVACLGAGTLPGGTPLTGWGWATVCAIGWVVVGAVGLVQLSRRSGTDDPAPLPRRRPRLNRPAPSSERGQAGPTRSATIFADRATIGSPPPGCAEPPTRYSPGTGDRLAGPEQRGQHPCEAVP